MVLLTYQRQRLIIGQGERSDLFGAGGARTGRFIETVWGVLSASICGNRSEISENRISFIKRTIKNLLHKPF
jgi:hypothetical protein